MSIMTVKTPDQGPRKDEYDQQQPVGVSAATA
jgi:hypothetical protein